MRILCFLLLIGLSEASLAFRCGHELVARGDTRYEVEAICGKPDDASTYSYHRSIASQEIVECHPVPLRTVESLTDAPDTESDSALPSCLTLVEDRLAVRVDVDVWLYDRGRNRFMKQIRFENGRVANIETLGYGKRHGRR